MAESVLKIGTEAPKENRVGLKVTQGEITSMTDSPSWAMAPFRMLIICFGSPAKPRATYPHPSSTARAQRSIGGRSLITPVFSFEPSSAVAEN